jgi:hypothetical protein
MKRTLLFLLLFISSLSFGQKINFSYDVAGNQTRRYISLNRVQQNSSDTIYKTPETLTKKDLIQDDLNSQISYYPNPVREELYVKWTEVDGQDMQTIELYDLAGKMIRIFPNQSAVDNAVINFESYPSGIYNLILVYANQERKSLKIMKQ